MAKTQERVYVVSTEQWINNELDTFDVIDTFDSFKDAKLKAQSLVGKFENMLNESNVIYWLEFNVYAIVLCMNNARTIVSYAPEFIKVA